MKPQQQCKISEFFNWFGTIYWHS